MSADPPDSATRRIRIGFMIAELLGGGAERSMLSIIDTLDRATFDPLLVLFEGRFDHEAPAGVPVITLARRGMGGSGRLVSRVRQLADLSRTRDLDLIVSFLIGPNIVALAAGALAGVPVIVGERSAPRQVLSATNRALAAPWLWKALVRLMYPRAAAIVANTVGGRDELQAMVGVPREVITVIPNPIDLERVRALAAEPAPEIDSGPELPLLVHVGRFSYAKDHLTLLRAFAIVRQHRPARLILVGNGEDEASVRNMVTALGLEADVQFIGFTRNPYRFLARATVSLLTSRFEGLPNTLLEAMALGVPIVSTACPYGPIELLKDSECGLLVPVGDAEAVAAAVEHVLDDAALRRRLVEAGTHRVKDFSRSHVAEEYERLFTRIARATSRRAAVTASHATSTR